MRYVSASAQILKLIGIEGSYGLSCRAICPNCGGLLVLRSKFYESNEHDELGPPLRDLLKCVVCPVCETKSSFERGSLSVDLDSARVKIISQDRAHYQALHPVEELLRRPRSATKAFWSLRSGSQQLELGIDLKYGVAVPALLNRFELICPICEEQIEVSGVAHLGFAGKTVLPPPGVWPLTARWYAHFRHIGVELAARVAKEYDCPGCKMRAEFSNTSKKDILKWLDEHLSLDWLNACMEVLPALQESKYREFLNTSVGINDHLAKVFEQRMLLTLHVLCDWGYQLEEFERNAKTSAVFT